MCEGLALSDRRPRTDQVDRPSELGVGHWLRGLVLPASPMVFGSPPIDRALATRTQTPHNPEQPGCFIRLPGHPRIPIKRLWSRAPCLTGTGRRHQPPTQDLPGVLTPPPSPLRSAASP